MEADTEDKIMRDFIELMVAFALGLVLGMVVGSASTDIQYHNKPQIIIPCPQTCQRGETCSSWTCGKDGWVK